MKGGAGYVLVTAGINGRKNANHESIDNHRIHSHSVCTAWSYAVAF